MKPFTDDDLQEMKWWPCEFKCGHCRSMGQLLARLEAAERLIPHVSANDGTVMLLCAWRKAAGK